LAWLERQANERLRTAEGRVMALSDRSADRDDAAGVNLLVQMLSLMLAQARRTIDEDLRSASSRPERVERLLGNVRGALGMVEEMVSASLDAVIFPPERDMASLVQPYIRLARAVTRDARTELIFGTMEAFDYNVWPNSYLEIEKNVEELAPDLAATVADLPRVAQIEYPAQADADTFLHTLVAHEVAHLALERPSVDPNYKTEWHAVFERRRQESAFAARPEDDDDVKRLSNWFREFTCDSLGLRLVGPSFLMALTEYLLPARDPNYGPGTFRQAHPPPAWRLHRLRDQALAYFDTPLRVPGHRVLRLAREQLDRYHALLPVDEYGAPPFDTRQEQVEPFLPAQPPAQEFIESAQREREFLAAALQDVVGNLDDWVEKARYTRGTFQRDLPLIWDKLDQGIAPAERVVHRRGRAWSPGETKWPRAAGEFELPAPASDWSEPVDWRSILNGGYFYYLHHSSRTATARTPEEERRGERDFSNSIIRGSIELSELHRQMLELRTQFDWLNDPQEPAT
jgi:hypothetical protein